MRPPIEALIAIVVGIVFLLMVLFASAFNPQYSMIFFLLGLGELLLFIAGILLLIDYLRFRDNFQPNSYRKKYYLLIISLVLYLFGALDWIATIHSDYILNLTYTSVIPIVLATFFYFQQLFVPIKNNQGQYDLNVLPEKESLSEKVAKAYQRLYYVPLILSIIAVVAILVLPLATATVKTLDYNYYYDTKKYRFFYSTYALNLFNFGSSVLGIVGIVALALVGSLLIFLEKKNVLEFKFNSFLQIGTVLLFFAGLFSILSIFALNYSFEKYYYSSLESGLVIAFVCVLISSAIALNLYIPINNLFENDSTDN